MYGVNIIPVAAPATPTVQNVGTTGATTYSYKFVFKDGVGTTAASTAGTTTTGNASLSTSNYNLLSGTPPPGPAVATAVHLAAGGATQGKIATIKAGMPLSVADTGLTGDGSTAPSADTTGQIKINGTSFTRLSAQSVLANPTGSAAAGHSVAVPNTGQG